MEITFDPRKNVLNKARHGFDFATLTVEFFASAVVIEAKSGRLNAIGPFGGLLLSVIFKPLGTQGLSVISMRPASRKERKFL